MSKKLIENLNIFETSAFGFMIKYMFLLVFMFACSSLRIGDHASNLKVKSEIDQNSGKFLDWMKNPRILCGQNTLCGLGEADSLEGAKSNARDEIAKIFSVKVNSSSRYNQEYDSTQKEGQVLERMTRDISEVTTQILEGVEIIKTGLYDQKYFVLMRLNKTLANRILNSNLSELEKIVKEKLFKNTRGDLLQASLLYPSWIDLVKRWEVINNKKYLKGIFRKLKIALNQKLASHVKLFLNSNNKILKSQLSEFGYEFLSNKNDADGFVSLKIILENIPMNVTGFFKNKLTINLEFNFKNISNQLRQKESQKTWILTGRSLKQLKINADEKLKIYFNNNIFNLLID